MSVEDHAADVVSDIVINLGGKAIRVTGELALEVAMLLFNLTKYLGKEAVGKVTTNSKSKGKVTIKTLKDKSHSQFCHVLNRKDLLKYTKILKKLGIVYSYQKSLDPEKVIFTFDAKDAQRVKTAIQDVDQYLETKNFMFTETKEVEPEIAKGIFPKMEESTPTTSAPTTTQVPKEIDPREMSEKSYLESIANVEVENGNFSNHSAEKSQSKPRLKDTKTKTQVKQGKDLGLGGRNSRPSVIAKVNNYKQKLKSQKAKSPQKHKSIDKHIGK